MTMLHEEEFIKSGLAGDATRKRFEAPDLGMVRPLGQTFWKNMVITALELDEEYSL